MIELHQNNLIFRYPTVHPRAKCTIDFQQTLRIPDDNREYPLPPGLGQFPLSHVDDFAERLPDAWRRHGGVFLPMYPSEALWIRFTGAYPCAVKIAAGKINAVSGKEWVNRLETNPQDYVVVPGQPWLDGFNAAEGFIRQFVAMPLGEGYTAEEQVTGVAEHGGLQLIAYPMKAAVYAERVEHPRVLEEDIDGLPMFLRSQKPDMGFAAGGLMRQDIYKDKYGISAWDQENGLRCFVHLVNSEQYQAITGHIPPHLPPTARDYTQAGLPWFEYYGEGKPLSGASALGGLMSLAAKVFQLNGKPLPDNDPVNPNIVKSVKGSTVVRDGQF